MKVRVAEKQSVLVSFDVAVHRGAGLKLCDGVRARRWLLGAKYLKRICDLNEKKTALTNTQIKPIAFKTIAIERQQQHTHTDLDTLRSQNKNQEQRA